ncbi:OLC1v1005092C1 [Oldenlandia corymbosa var. corymbosa]|uniref:OLC1v1005092C1 n=1 Tax=Oldenlandia corymbosa var. corymbosa TaxID=529605 RepID=A0AAV1DGS0_OLDCO|nr:OLC1v1005092C1 [Oldenlandia corymbosa var. corymbosa]
MEPWTLEIGFKSSVHPFPEVGVGLSPDSVVYYAGTKISPPDCTVMYTWSREIKGFIGLASSAAAVHQFWTVVGSSSNYLPTKDDLGHCLRLVSYAVNSNGVKMSSTFIFVTSPVRPLTLSPSPRSIIPTISGLKRLGKPQSVVENSSGFRVLSYNILADMYIKSGRDNYDYCPPEKLSWEYRCQNLLLEILSYEADILCLQEVQSDHYKTFFEPELARFGYLSIYKGKRKGISKGKELVTDGCATFFRHDKFKLVKKYEIEYEKVAVPMISRLKSEQRNLGIVRLLKDNIATVVILEEIDNCHSRICVANTHLLSGKGVSDVRLFQVINLVRGLQKIDSLGIPVLVCGDMNSAPGSDTHAYLVEGKVGYYRQEKKDILGMSKFLKLNHPMNLASAYSGTPNAHGNETLDYILYSQNKLKVDGVFEIPSYESIGKRRLLPTPQWSSDHVALVANVRIKKAYREQNCSEPLPTDPWEEVKKVKSFEVQKKAFKKQKERPNIYHIKNMERKLIFESLAPNCKIMSRCQFAGVNIKRQLIGCQ